MNNFKINQLNNQLNYLVNYYENQRPNLELFKSKTKYWDWIINNFKLYQNQTEKKEYVNAALTLNEGVLCLKEEYIYFKELKSNLEIHNKHCNIEDCMNQYHTYYTEIIQIELWLSKLLKLVDDNVTVNEAMRTLLIETFKEGK